MDKTIFTGWWKQERRKEKQVIHFQFKHQGSVYESYLKKENLHKEICYDMQQLWLKSTVLGCLSKFICALQELEDFTKFPDF